jgi:dephospho-CoA kinase
MKIAITGNIAAGKSTVSEWLLMQGICGLDADKIVHQMYSESEWIEKLSMHFGSQILDSTGQILRAELGKIVFSDASKLELLNELTSAPIRARLESELTRLENLHQIVFCEATLLLERNWAHFFDLLIVISAPDDLRKNRLLAKGLSAQEAKNRIQAQELKMSQSQKIKQADLHFTNNSDLNSFYSWLDKCLTPKIAIFNPKL